VSHGTCNYIYMYIYTVANNIVLHVIFIIMVFIN